MPGFLPAGRNTTAHTSPNKIDWQAYEIQQLLAVSATHCMQAQHVLPLAPKQACQPAGYRWLPTHPSQVGHACMA
jgi:hypothetical protein